MIEPGMDIQRFAEKLSQGGAEAVKWEIRKLQWIREERAKQLEQSPSTKQQPQDDAG